MWTPTCSGSVVLSQSYKFNVIIGRPEVCSLPPPQMFYFSWMLRKWPDNFAFLYLSSSKLGGASAWDHFRLRSIISADGGKAYKKLPVLWWGAWKPPIILQIVIHRASKESLFQTLFLATAAFTDGLWHDRFFSGLESFLGSFFFFDPLTSEISFLKRVQDLFSRLIRFVSVILKCPQVP